jgi:hypothetical protein
MIDVRFDQFHYYPTLRTRQAELKGLAQLDDERKSKIVPLLTLGRWPKALDFDRSAEKAAEAMGDRPYFLDLTTDARHLTDHHRSLSDPGGHFESWQTFAKRSPLAIPVAQMPQGARLRDVAQQAKAIESDVGRVAFRIRDFDADTRTVISALNALDDVANAIVFIDCQYIRNALAAYSTATVATINLLRSEFPEIFVAVLATSFPVSTLEFADASKRYGTIDMLERELHSRIGGPAVAAYGDHASIHSVVYDDVPIMKWSPRIDFPRELDWYFERRPGAQSTEAGYIDAARAIVDAEPGIGAREIWGEEMVRAAAGGAPFAKAPGPWISVRVNMHLARQIDFSERLASNGFADDDDGEED